ncbi:MAG: metal ABC transporter permease [Arcanobacterium sp.]
MLDPFILSILFLAITTALACALPGVFIVLRGQAMLIDGIGHAAFPGIAVGYLLTHDLQSPLLVVGAAASGLVVVWGAQWLENTGLITGDAPLGLIFPALFAGGVLIVSGKFSDVHLDTHIALVGDLNLVAFTGPHYGVLMGIIFLLNTLFLGIFYRPLKTSTFDPEYAQMLGTPRWLNGAFMFLVAVTVTAAFNAAGALLVLALIVSPAATAQIFSTRLPQMIAWTLLIAVLGAIGGFVVAYYADLSTSSAMAAFYGTLFFGVLLAHRIRSNRINMANADSPIDTIGTATATGR